MDVPRTKEKAAEHVMKAQETALTALQHGYKLTAGQKKLIDRMSPKEKKEMEQRVTKVSLGLYSWPSHAHLFIFISSQ